MHFTEEQIRNIYLKCNSIPLKDLLEWCLDPETGTTIDGLKSAGYNKIDLLERQYGTCAEERIWQAGQNSIDILIDFVGKIEKGLFSDKYLEKAKNRIRELALIKEDSDWKEIQESNDIPAVTSFINKCKTGVYTHRYLEKATTLLMQLEENLIEEEWKKVLDCNEKEGINERIQKINEFIEKYANNPSPTAKKYVSYAYGLLKQIEDELAAEKDWEKLQSFNASILDYVKFMEDHPHSKYCDEARRRIANMKGDILNDMRLHPFRYDRETVHRYISTKILTMEDLVDKSHVLTDRGYSHIREFPQLNMEQRELPLSRKESPESQPGNTDIYFFGVPGSGKTCVLAGLLGSFTGINKLGFNFDPRGSGGGGDYATDLKNYAIASFLPPGTHQDYIQVIDAEINESNGNLHKISLIEMSGEKTSTLSSMNDLKDLSLLGPGASGLLSNDNKKALFFVIDPTNRKNIDMHNDRGQWVMQSDVLNCIVSLLSNNPSLMKKIVAIHVILTKSDTIGDVVTESMVRSMLNDQGYAPVFSSLKKLCVKYKINKQSGRDVGLFPFCIGKFMPGDVYTYDETDSLKILKVIQDITDAVRKKNFWDILREWFTS